MYIILLLPDQPEMQMSSGLILTRRARRVGFYFMTSAPNVLCTAGGSYQQRAAGISESPRIFIFKFKAVHNHCNVYRSDRRARSKKNYQISITRARLVLLL